MQHVAGQVLAYEPAIRLGAFLTVLAALVLAEAFFPRKDRAVSRWARWPSNLGLTALNTVVLRLLLPGAAVGAALFAQDRGWGLLNIVTLPGWFAVLLAILVLDFAIYVQHVMFHAVPLLWRLHRMHHADLDVDVTTGARFHPIEILLSMLIKVGVVVAVGAPAAAVVLFEVLLNAASMFNHSNIKLPAGLDAPLRWVIVTPDMHRVHHSWLPTETNTNFGFQLTWWDRVFGTYRPQPSAGHDGMTLGLDILRDPADLRLDKMLIQPFRASPGAYPMFGRKPSKQDTN